MSKIKMKDSKILVTYFSVFPAEEKFTEQIAKIIAQKTNGALIEIQCEKTYPEKPEEYPKIEKIVHQEIKDDIRPGIKNDIPIKEYDTIFVGYPIWHYTLPQVMLTFFDKYDFSGKTIIPFNTHEGSEDSGTWEMIQKLEPDAEVLKGLAIRGFDVEKGQEQTVEKWLNELPIV